YPLQNIADWSEVGTAERRSRSIRAADEETEGYQGWILQNDIHKVALYAKTVRNYPSPILKRVASPWKLLFIVLRFPLNYVPFAGFLFVPVECNACFDSRRFSKSLAGSSNYFHDIHIVLRVLHTFSPLPQLPKVFVNVISRPVRGPDQSSCPVNAPEEH